MGYLRNQRDLLAAMAFKTLARTAILAAALVNAQFPPKPEGVKELKSKIHAGVKVSYKEPGLCETTPGVKSYAGEVLLFLLLQLCIHSMVQMKA